jgi:hypothetical protein
LRLFSDFLLDLFKGFQEKLFYFRSLIKNYLSESSDLFELVIPNFQIFSLVQNILLLLLDDRLMLVPHHFFFLFEVTNDLLKALLQNFYFLLVLLGSLLLKLLASHVLLLSSLIDVDVPFEVFVHLLQICNFTFVVVDGVSLRNCLFGQFRVLKVDVFLNLLNV